MANKTLGDSKETAEFWEEVAELYAKLGYKEEAKYLKRAVNFYKACGYKFNTI